MNAVVLDLAQLDLDDLKALHLGAQVVRHRAEVEGRPRVATFFVALEGGLERELARRTQDHEQPTGSLTLTVEEPAGWPDELAEDRRSIIDSLDLLAGNPRLPIRVRTACATIRERLVRPH